MRIPLQVRTTTEDVHSVNPRFADDSNSAKCLPTAPCPFGSLQLNDLCYRIILDVVTFDSAADACRAHGGELVSIPDKDTNILLGVMIDDYVFDEDGAMFFIGALKNFGQWAWTDGKPFNYTDWKPG